MFSDYQAVISVFQTAPCLHFEEFLPNCGPLVEQKIQEAALALQKPKGVPGGPSWQIPPLQLQGVGMCFSYLLLCNEAKNNNNVSFLMIL